MLKKVQVLGAIGLSVLMLIVILQNTQSVETKILFVTITMPRAAMLFGSLLVGLALGVLGTWFFGRRKNG